MNVAPGCGSTTGHNRTKGAIMAATKERVDWRRRAAAAEEALAAFKTKVTETTREVIEEYSLDICNEGLKDWANRLGIEPPTPPTYTVTVTLEYEGVSAEYGEDPDHVVCVAEDYASRIVAEHSDCQVTVETTRDN